MDAKQLKEFQALPLESKVSLSKARIREWVSKWGDNHVYVSFSGGKDSTVLLHLVRSTYPDVPAVYIQTGMELPSVLDLIRRTKNVIYVKPKYTFRQIIEKYGYPVISKETAYNIQYGRRARENGNMELFDRYVNGIRKKADGTIYTYGKMSALGRELLETDIPISNQCCNIMKKHPAKQFEKDNDMKPFIGLLAEESQLRKTEYLKTGCNAFEAKRPRSIPLGFWTEQDILQYIKDNNLEIAADYGEIIETPKGLACSGIARTGCCFCLFGVHREKEPNKIQYLHEHYPKVWDYCMKPFEEGGLGLEKVCKAAKIPTKIEKEEK